MTELCLNSLEEDIVDDLVSVLLNLRIIKVNIKDTIIRKTAVARERYYILAMRDGHKYAKLETR